MALDFIKKGILFVIADILSVITVLLCLIQKLPQIRDVHLYKSAKGISTTSLYLELISYTTMMLYNYTYEYSLLSYLEYPILLVQEYILIGLVLHHKHSFNKQTLYYVGGYGACVLLFMYQILPRFILSMLVPFCTPVGATSKIIQLLEILRARDSTTVSLTTWFLSAFTNLTRIYTVSIESGDRMLLLNFTISFALSSSIYLAAFYYKRTRPNWRFWEKKVIVVKK